MNGLENIIKLMSDEEKRLFTAYLQNNNKRDDTKNIHLFKLLETDDINVLKKLYKGENNDAYHALRKRLYDSLINFMANRTFETATGEAHEILRLLVVSRFFLEHQLTKTAFKCLNKAENKALAQENFSLLNEIYHTIIQYAHLYTPTGLDEVIKKFNDNRKKLQLEEQLNIGYALLRRELNEIHHKGKITDFTAFISETMKSLGVSIHEILTFKSLYQILFIANEYATIQNNFTLIEPFVEKSYAFISLREEQAEGHLYYHIYILYYMANIYFRNHNFEQSSHYLKLMHGQMIKQNKRHYKRFALHYHLLSALNYNFTGAPEKAIDTIENTLASAPAKSDVINVNDLHLCLTMFYTQQNNRTALKYMHMLNHTENWYEKKMGMLWTIRKVLLDIIIYAQFENVEQALYLLKTFKKRYKNYLEQVNEQRVITFAQLVGQYLSKPEILKEDSFIKQVNTLLKPGGKEDLFALSFIAWLLAKTNKQDIYQTTLKLLSYSSPSHSA